MFHALYQQLQEDPSTSTTKGAPDVKALPFPATYLPVAEVTEAARLSEVADPNAFLTLVVGDQSRAMTEESFRRMPKQTLKAQLVSRQGWVYSRVWEGVSLKSIFYGAPLPEGSLYLVQTDSSGNREWCRWSEDLFEHTLLVTEIDGKPLPAWYGGPLWFAMFGRYHDKGLGRLTHLTITDQEPQGAQMTELLGFDSRGAIEPGEYVDMTSGKMSYVDGM